ncbi:MAG: hypothetical protein HYW49_08730 [Deltaproteobacteria bacterium]|nr:hypothetical protein [Deltaproteobacteria bacterium]
MYWPFILVEIFFDLGHGVLEDLELLAEAFRGGLGLSCAVLLAVEARFQLFRELSFDLAVERLFLGGVVADFRRLGFLEHAARVRHDRLERFVARKHARLFLVDEHVERVFEKSVVLARGPAGCLQAKTEIHAGEGIVAKCQRPWRRRHSGRVHSALAERLRSRLRRNRETNKDEQNDHQRNPQARNSF